MAFADDFATCMSNGGIRMDPSAVPDQNTLPAVLDYLKQYLQRLDPDVRAGLDDATSEHTASIALADSEVGAVDPAYVGLLHAFDNATGFPLSLCVEWCDHCIQQAGAAATA
jgi:hypothetical protein